jgi:hypothetical protein
MLNFLGREGEQMFRISDAFPAEESMTVLQQVLAVILIVAESVALGCVDELFVRLDVHVFLLEACRVVRALGEWIVGVWVRVLDR